MQLFEVLEVLLSVSPALESIPSRKLFLDRGPRFAVLVQKLDELDAVLLFPEVTLLSFWLLCLAFRLRSSCCLLSEKFLSPLGLRLKNMFLMLQTFALVVFEEPSEVAVDIWLTGNALQFLEHLLTAVEVRRGLLAALFWDHIHLEDCLWLHLESLSDDFTFVHAGVQIAHN